MPQPVPKPWIIWYPIHCDEDVCETEKVVYRPEDMHMNVAARKNQGL